MGYGAFRQSTSPSNMLNPQGQAWSVAFGSEEDQFVLMANQLAESRWPDYAPMDANGTSSQALSYIGYNTQLQFVFDDDATFDATRAYYKTGFTQGADGPLKPIAGATLSWLPDQYITAGQLIGVPILGLVPSGQSFTTVWGLIVVATSSGYTGSSNPFPRSLTQGETITDGEVTWQWQGALISSYGSALPAVLTPPVTPAPPTGWYYAGANQGLLNALVNAGFYRTDPNGNLVPPRIYNNRDFVNITSSSDALGWDGAASANLSLTVHVTTAGTAGTSGVVAFSTAATPTNWSAHMDATEGQFINDGAGHVYFCTVGGETGATNPFPGSPSVSTWPPTAGAGINDGEAQWLYATFSPIPLTVPLGGSWWLTMTGAWSTGTSTIQIVQSQPDGNASKWSRMWLVVPLSNLTSPLLWGTGDGGYNGLWGGPPGGGPPTPGSPVGVWGAGRFNSNINVAGILTSIFNRWIGAHVQLVGVWGVYGYDTELDTIPLPNWNEGLAVTIGGTEPLWFRLAVG